VRTKFVVVGVVAMLVASGLWFFALRSDNAQAGDLADFLESRTVDGPAYPAFLTGEGADDVDPAHLMYGYAQSLIAVAGLPDDRYDQVSAEVVEYLAALDKSGNRIDALTASLLVGLPEAGTSDAAREYVDRYLVGLDVGPDDYQTYAELSNVVRARFWVSQDVAIDPTAVGIPPPSCTAVKAALDEGQLSAIGSLVIVDSTVRSRCDHAEFSLDSVLVDAPSALLVEAMALRESGWVTEGAFNQFQSEFEADVGRFDPIGPLLLPLGVASGISEPGNGRTFETLLAIGEAGANGHSVTSRSSLSLWRMQDIARLAGTDLAAEPELLLGGLTGAERTIYQVMGYDVEGISTRAGADPEIALHYWIVAIDVVDATGSCDGLVHIGPDPSTPLVKEAYDYIAAICGPNFATFEGPEESVAAIAEPASDTSQQFERAVSRSLRCRLGLPTAAPQPRTEPYPSFLLALWISATLTEDCA